MQRRRELERHARASQTGGVSASSINARTQPTPTNARQHGTRMGEPARTHQPTTSHRLCAGAAGVPSRERRPAHLHDAVRHPLLRLALVARVGRERDASDRAPRDRTAVPRPAVLVAVTAAKSDRRVRALRGRGIEADAGGGGGALVGWRTRRRVDGRKTLTAESGAAVRSASAARWHLCMHATTSTHESSSSSPHIKRPQRHTRRVPSLSRA
eukprot:1326958-Pleurochrysis_carterae.AAC.4